MYQMHLPNPQMRLQNRSEEFDEYEAYHLKQEQERQLLRNEMMREECWQQQQRMQEHMDSLRFGKEYQHDAGEERMKVCSN